MCIYFLGNSVFWSDYSLNYDSLFYFGEYVASVPCKSKDLASAGNNGISTKQMRNNEEVSHMHAEWL